MRNLKKFLALVLAMMMALSLMVTVNAADPATPTDFDDLSDGTATYSEAIDILSALGIIKGYEGTNDFKPLNPITRAEVAALIYRIAANDAEEAQAGIYKDYNRFNDVNENSWYAGVVNYCANAELVKGDGTNYAPRKNVTGYEVLAMVLRVLGYDQNKEFEGSGWQIRTASYARKVGLTKNIKEGTLGQPATREVVCEILFQALQAPTVTYNMIYNYVEDLLINADYYSGVYDEDVYNTLMYANYGIVGKSDTLAFDKFGRPTVVWITDMDDDTVTDGTKYIENNKALGFNPDTNETEGEDETVISLSMTPVKTYTDAVTECQLTKDINNDKSIPWGSIVEVLNGNQTEPTDDTGNDLNGVATETLAKRDDALLDALHTTTKYIGATGRTTEIYKLDQKVNITKATGAITADPVSDTVASYNLWVFVYIDTFLGKVTDTTPAIEDSAGHVIKKATATVELGNTVATSAELVKLTLDTEDYTKDELILVQTSGGTVTPLDDVDSPAKAPLAPADVPNTAAMFTTTTAKVASKKPTTQRVTVKATVGAQDAKMGIIDTNGHTYMASNTFLAGRVSGGNVTVLNEWYKDSNVKGSADENKGLTNNMIGKTFDLVLDQNGYIVGVKEVLTTNDGVGVITGVDSKRIGSGKYLIAIDAYMTDGTTQTFYVPRLYVKANDTDGTLATSVDPSDTTQGYGFFSSASAAETAWVKSNNMYGSQIGVGSLVKFANVTINGETYSKIDDYDHYADVAGSDTFADIKAGNTEVSGTSDGHTLSTSVGTLKASDVASNIVETGVTDTLTVKDGGGNDRTTKMLDDKSVVFVTEYDYRYNAGDENEGNNVNMTYQVYNGFKNIPTIEANTGKIVYQRLDKNPQYFLIGKTDECKDYVIKDQAKITVDDSYLLLSRGATYDEYSEYNVLKDGELTTLKVANGNNAVNAAIEATLTGGKITVGVTEYISENQLIVVTGRNAKGYVTSVMDIASMAGAGTAAQKALVAENTAGKSSSVIKPDTAAAAEDAATVRKYGESVLQLAGNANGFLTIADGCKVKLVNRDLGTTYDISLNEAIRYANGVDNGKTGGEDATLPSHGLVFELNEYGYVCALYVIDDWNANAT